MKTTIHIRDLEQGLGARIRNREPMIILKKVPWYDGGTPMKIDESNHAFGVHLDDMIQSGIDRLACYADNQNDKVVDALFYELLKPEHKINENYRAQTVALKFLRRVNETGFSGAQLGTATVPNSAF